MKKKLYTLAAVFVVRTFVLTAGSDTETAILTDAPDITDDSLSGTIAVSGAFVVSPIMSAWASE